MLFGLQFDGKSQNNNNNNNLFGLLVVYLSALMNFLFLWISPKNANQPKSCIDYYHLPILFLQIIVSVLTQDKQILERC